jgi:hypothetical protein
MVCCPGVDQVPLGVCLAVTVGVLLNGVAAEWVQLTIGMMTV